MKSMVFVSLIKKALMHVMQLIKKTLIIKHQEK